MRPAPLAALLLLACGLGPAPGITPPRAQDCADLRRALIGTWVREGSAMELRPDGSMLRDNAEGAFRWTAPAQATIDVPGSHEDHTYGLQSAALLLDVDPDGTARVWTRSTGVPVFPDGCFDLRGSLVGSWTDGALSERFLADGEYERGETRGNWSLPEAGVLDVAVGLNVRRYRIAMSTRDTLVSVLDGPPSTDDVRPAVVIETRER